MRAFQYVVPFFAYRAKRYCYTIPASWNMPVTYKGRLEHRERLKYTMVFVYQLDFCFVFCDYYFAIWRITGIFNR